MKTVLHVGCGIPRADKLHAAFRGEGWSEIRLDINPNVKPDIVTTMTKMPEVSTESVDAVWSSHNLEHVYAHEVPLALTEFRRVLKPDGFALITLPDLQQVALLIANDKLDEPAYVSPAGPISPLDMVYGLRPALARGVTFMAHRCGFTAKTLMKSLEDARFAHVIVHRYRPSFELWALAFKRKPKEADAAAIAAATIEARRGPATPLPAA
jgi:SAM-dependent methyltransferase